MLTVALPPELVWMLAQKPRSRERTRRAQPDRGETHRLPITVKGQPFRADNSVAEPGHGPAMALGQTCSGAGRRVPSPVLTGSLGASAVQISIGGTPRYHATDSDHCDLTRGVAATG